MFEKQSVCTACGFVGKPKKITKGNVLVELILWLFFIIPGLIYSIWRLSSRYTACPNCKNQATMIPVDSPNGQRLLAEQKAIQPKQSEAIAIKNSADAEQKAKENGRFVKIVVWVLAIVFWYISIPILIIKKTKFSKRKRVAFAIAFFIIFIAIDGVIYHYANRKPSIVINEPQNNSSIQANKVTIKGKIDPAGAELKAGGILIRTSSGEFSYDMQLPNEKNTIVLAVRNGSSDVNTFLTINRIFTDEEKAQIEKQKADAEAKRVADEAKQKKAVAEQQAKSLADQKAWDSSKAGQLCKKHPDWTKEDCTNLANKKIWIGMSYDMLVEMWGKPNHANPSNYGGGTEWQWCWTAYSSPNCFYDTNGDGLVDSYN